MGNIRLQQMAKHYGDQEVLDGIDLEIRSGELLVILGASGGGKTTLLNLIAGLIPPSSGKILFDGIDVTDRDVGRRNIAYVFQDFALYPHMTVEQNIRFPLENMRLENKEVERKAFSVLEKLKLVDIGKKYPTQLSGGQKQRVAIGRALVRDPYVFLFDEPLSSLDQQLQDHLRVELKQLHRQLKKTFVYVTHDQLSAMILGDRIAFLGDKKIRQIAPPAELYHCPRDMDVAKFLGFPSVNLLSRKNFCLLSEIGIPERAKVVGVRPEHLKVERDEGGKFVVEWTQQVGYADFVHFKVGDEVISARGENMSFEPGQRVRCMVGEKFLMFFDEKENRIENE